MLHAREAATARAPRAVTRVSMEKQSENVQADVDNTDTSADLPEPLFRALDASNVERVETSELESLCMSCGEMVKKINI